MTRENKKPKQTFDGGKSKKRKVIIRIVIICLIVLLIGIWIHNTRKKAEEILASLTTVETQAVTKRDLVRSIGATGQVVSLEKRDVIGSLTGTELATVDVEVGDRVQKGDPIATFDTTQIVKNLEKARENLQLTQTRNDLTEKDLSRSVSDATRNRDYVVDSAQNSVDRLAQSLAQAKKEYEDHIALRDRKNSLQNNYNTLLAQYRTLTGTESLDVSGNELPAEALALIPSIREALEAANQAAANYQADGGDNVTTSLINAYNQATYNYQDALKSYQNTVDSQASAVASARSNRTSAELGLSTANEEDTIESYEKQLEKADVTAPISGIVTAVNYRAGDTYAQGALVTIQDDSSFEIETQISEYDISDIAVGQHVLIKTGATGDQELPGHVIKIAPVATAGSGSVTYTVRISIDEPNDRLRLDMSASLSIILEEHDDALTVPYNAIQEDEKGQTYVEVKQGEDDYRRVDVEVLLESNYYTEIAPGSVKEGDEVKIISTQEVTSILDELMLY